MVYNNSDMWIDGTAWLLHCLSLFASSAWKCLLSLLALCQSRKRQWKQNHQQFHHPLQEHQSHWSITCLCGLQPDQFTRSLKWTLLIKYCSARLPVSCQSPCYGKKIKMSTVQNSQKFLFETWSTNTSLHVLVFSIPMTAVLTGCWLDTGCIIESSQ